MSPKLYYNKMSPASRATLLTIKALNIDVELVSLNLAEQEHLTTDFLQINPFHTVPTLQEENGFTLWDSHAINAYLADKYAEDDALYPKDLEKRATINQRLHFDNGILFSAIAAIVVSVLREGAKSVAREKANALVQGYTLLETILEKSKFVAGNSLTIADFSIVASISSANVLVPLATNRFPRVLDWLSRIQTLPYYMDANQDGLNTFATVIKSKLVSR